jgi:hypothetical protein
MDFKCPVPGCRKIFYRPQDRLAHLHQKSDAQHQAHVCQQAKATSRRFSSVVKVAHSARGNNHRKRNPDVLPTVPGELLDVDMLPLHTDGSLPPSTHDMDVDEDDQLLDKEGDLVIFKIKLRTPL